MDANTMDKRLLRLYDEVKVAKDAGIGCFDALGTVRLAFGYSEFDHANDKLRRARLDNASGREKRKKFSWAKYRRLYEKQRGICAWCDTEMVLLRGKVDIDHRDPNAENFNDDSNLCLMHSGCNRSKNAKSIPEQSKATGKGYPELLGDEI